MENGFPSAEEIVQLLDERIHYRFKDATLAVMAVTHSSAKDKTFPSNERLEFLGDSILGHVIAEYLFHHFPQYEEGDLSTMKSIIVSAKTLSARAKDLDIERIVILGRGLTEKKALPQSILCNAFEAIVAALYLDAGFDIARDFILTNTRDKIEEILKNEHEKNYKSMLQDYAQRTHATIPNYRVAKEMGPDHKKMFQVVVELDSKTFGPAWGPSKKEAEQKAARIALETLGLVELSAAQGE